MAEKTDPEHPTVGMIGLGIMGAGMAQNLLKGGVDLVVYNRTRARTDRFRDQGASVADSPRELAARCGVILVCVGDTPDVREVLLGADGVVQGASPDTLVIDLSTISPAATREMATELNAHDIHLCDAPVSGGSEGAAAGTLSVMLGGAPEDVERARPYLEMVGRTITHMGPVGSGQLCKLVNQALGAVTMLAVSEALTLAKACGLDPSTVIEATSGGAAGSWLLSNRGPQMVARDWTPGFMIDLQQKDLRLVLEAADEAGVPLLATGMVSQMYGSLIHAGFGRDGNHTLIRAVERLAGFDENGSVPPPPA
jgi:3-hydroxyisobutyrate dehydrogenase-like beta-hydroxyacid dehydrogenase